MEMLSSSRGDKHEFCFVSLSLGMLTVAKSLKSPIHDSVE